MMRVIQIVALALLSVCSGIAWTAETSNDTKPNKYIGKSENDNWQLVVTFANSRSGKISVYMDSAMGGDKPRQTVLSNKIAGQLGETWLTSSDLYFIVIGVTIKNLQKKEANFFLDDISLIL
jgi:hypothetical protein